MTRELWNLSTLFVVSRFLSTKVFPEGRLKAGFETHKKWPFPQIEVSFNRGNKYKDFVNIFPEQMLCSLNGGVSKERLQCKSQGSNHFFFVFSFLPCSSLFLVLLCFPFVRMIFDPVGHKKPAFWPFFTQMPATFVRFVSTSRIAVSENEIGFVFKKID